MTRPLLALLLAIGSPAAGCQGSQPEPAVVRLSTGAQPLGAAIADWNGDGKPDLAVSNQGGASVSVFLGDGRGGFRPADGSPFPAGDHPTALATGDLNGDGRMDLAIANHDTSYVTVLFGDGQGGLHASQGSRVTVASRPHPHMIAAADFDRDGRLDLVTDSWQEDQLLVLWGDGKGTFPTPHSRLATGRMPYYNVIAADLNGDGAPDLAVPNHEGSGVTVLLSRSGRRFEPAAGSPFPIGESPFGVAAGDVNGDGHPDLALVHYSGQLSDRSKDALTLLLGDGRGGFRSAPGSPFAASGSPVRTAAADFDGDGVMDVAAGLIGTREVRVWWGGKGGLRPGPAYPAGEVEGIAAGDLDGDGRADLVATDMGGNAITVFLSRRPASPKGQP
jgi:hypothetical protein